MEMLEMTCLIYLFSGGKPQMMFPQHGGFLMDVAFHPCFEAIFFYLFFTMQCSLKKNINGGIHKDIRSGLEPK